MRKMKNKSISAAWSVIPLAVACVVFIYLFSVSAVTVSVTVAILSIYCVLMTVSRKNSRRAQQLQINPYSYKGTQGNIFKIALSISSPFYFCLLLLALFPVQHYSVWLLFFIPAMLVFCLPLMVVADFCKEFLIPKRIFWSVQLLIQLSCIGVGRVFSTLLLSRFG